MKKISAILFGAALVAAAASPALSQTTPVLSVLGSTNGWTPKLANALSSVTPLVLKSSAGQLGTIQCYNPNSSQVYIQFFNASTGIVIGTTIPLLSVAIGPTSTGGLALANPGINFSTAISIVATTTATGSTAPATAPDCNVVIN